MRPRNLSTAPTCRHHQQGAAPHPPACCSASTHSSAPLPSRPSAGPTGKVLLLPEDPNAVIICVATGTGENKYWWRRTPHVDASFCVVLWQCFVYAAQACGALCSWRRTAVCDALVLGAGLATPQPAAALRCPPPLTRPLPPAPACRHCALPHLLPPHVHGERAQLQVHR